MKLARDDLPTSLHDIVELIGLAATLQLVERYGGITALYIPRDIDAEHQIALALGLTAARRLAQTFGGDCIRNIPRCADGLRRMRNREIKMRRGEGVSAARLALSFGLTERQIWSILSESDVPDDRQSALF